MAASKKSTGFEAFVASVREPMTSTNIDAYRGLGALRLLEGDERAEAEDLLFDRLAHDDGRAAYALADIASTRAVGPLRDRLVAGVPAMMRVAAALALHQLGDDSGRAAAIDVLGSGNSFEQQSAMSVLGVLGGVDVERALERAFDDPDRSVRSDAARTLIKLHGLEQFKDGYQRRLGLLQNRLSSPLATVRAAAATELHDVFSRHAQGESPEQLALTWRADDEHEPLRSFAVSMQSNAPPWQHDFPLQIIAGLRGYERTWAEDCLWHFLPSDPRAARAFAQLGIQRAVAPLGEVLPKATGVLAVEVAAALWHLAQDPAARDVLRAATHDADPVIAARATAALGA